MDCSLPGSSIHGIFQARVLEWVAIAFSAREGIPYQTANRFPVFNQRLPEILDGCQRSTAQKRHMAHWRWAPKQVAGTREVKMHCT